MACLSSVFFAVTLASYKRKDGRERSAGTLVPMLFSPKSQAASQSARSARPHAGGVLANQPQGNALEKGPPLKRRALKLRSHRS